jgi:hypothetical protein
MAIVGEIRLFAVNEMPGADTVTVVTGPSNGPLDTTEGA